MVACVGRLLFTSFTSKPDAHSKVQGVKKQPHSLVAYLCVYSEANTKTSANKNNCLICDENSAKKLKEHMAHDV